MKRTCASHTQSKSTPSKAKLRMKLIKLTMNWCRFALLATISLNTVCVTPGSLKVHPPRAIMHLSPGFRRLRSVRSEKRATGRSSIGAILNSSGVIKPKENTRCVKAPEGICRKPYRIPRSRPYVSLKPNIPSSGNISW